MSNDIKVSVVIPVYNSIPYLEECLDSVGTQTLSSIEIICVDDGSTDDSLSLLNKYAQDDPRIHILQQKNQYAGVARNTGLAKAIGEYVIFWDSDDYFASDALEKMYYRAKEYDADICICDAQDFDNETGKKLAHSYLRQPYPTDEVFSINTFKENIYTFTSPVTWNKLIRRDFLLEQDIKFQDTKHINDVLGIFTAMSCAKRIVTLPEKLIFYRCNRTDSLMSTYGNKKESVFLAYRQLRHDLTQKGILEDAQIRQSFDNKVLAIVLFMMRYCNTYEQYANYYDMMLQEYFPEMQLDNLSENYIYSDKDKLRYAKILNGDNKDYLFTEFQALNTTNNELRQKIHTLRDKVHILRERNVSLKEYKNESKQLRCELENVSLALSNVQAELDETKQQLANIRASKSYKFAKGLTSPIHKARALFKRK